MKTISKIVSGIEIADFDIIQGRLYIMRNSNIIVMSTQEKNNADKFCGVIVSGDLNGWGLGFCGLMHLLK